MKKNHWLLIILGWQVIGLVVSLIISLPSTDFHYFIHELLICLTFTNIVGFGGSLLVVFYNKKLVHTKTNKYIIYAFLLLCILIVGVLAAYVSLNIGGYICGFDHFEVNRWHLAIITVNFIILSAIALISLLLVLYEKISTNLKKEIMENEKLQRLQIESKLALLQSKINPHFLFNTLNTMLDTVKRDPDQTEKIILNLSDIYRKTLTMPDNSLVPLKDEIVLVKEYLEIEKVRMGSRLSFSLNINESLYESKVPPMILQILVENSIKHGLSPKKEGGNISVDIEKKDNEILMIVSDTGVGITDKKHNNGFGLFSIKQRLQLMYENAKFEINNQQNGGTKVEIVIPYAN